MQKSSVIAAISFAAVMFILCPPAGSEQGSTGPEYRWSISTPEEQGIDSGALADIMRSITENEPDLHSLILMRNGKLVLEAYNHPYSAETTHNVKSVSKSIISALVGIALREKLLEDLDHPVADYFPEYFPEEGDPRKRQITLRHLLTMTSGLDLDENGPKMGKVFQSDDWIRAAFQAPMAADPGTTFSYSTPLTHTMSGILTESTGSSLLEFARTHLFSYLAIQDVQWARGPKGYYFGGAELWMRPRDMAKFGQLFLDDGAYAGKQLVPKEWVKESTRDHMGKVANKSGYGYWWWLNGPGIYLAMGWGGQGILVHPDEEIVMVITAADHQARDRIAFSILSDAVKENKPLPPAPEALAALHSSIARLENPAPLAVPELPEMARKISGKTYRLTGHPMFTDIRFDFEDQGATAKIIMGTGNGPVSAEVGLDGLYRLSDTGTYGDRPDNNRSATRGRWTAADTFTIDSQQVGSPVASTLVVTFGEGTLTLEGKVRPLGLEMKLSGTVEPVDK